MITRLSQARFAFFSIVIAGCANMSVGEQFGLSTAACAGVGTIVGLATGEASSGAIVGGGCLALASIAIAVNYYDKQSRTVRQDEEMYGYSLTGLEEPMVRIRNARISPSKVRLGEKLSIVTDYSVIAPKEQQNTDIQVEESIILTNKNNGQSKEMNRPPLFRKAGGWDSTVTITVPDELQPGEYDVEHKIAAGNSYAKDKSSFMVVSKT